MIIGRERRHPRDTGARPAAFVLGLALIAAAAGPAAQDAKPGLRIWKEFASLLRSGRFAADRIRPMPEMAGSEGVLMGFLDKMRDGAHWEEWDKEPDVQKNGSNTNYIIPLSFGASEPSSYCFMFVEEGGTWFFRHLEAIFIRLDKTPPPPTSDFPDATEAQKAWDREEGYWSNMVRWRNAIAKEKGTEYFYDTMLRDGPGYYVWAKSRTPFLPPHRAFILFLCWEQAHLRGHNSLLPGMPGVRLEKLDDEDAVVRFAPMCFMLYRAAAHLKPQISFADYREMFETIWQDRAKAAGWTLKIEYADLKTPDGVTECVFRFRRVRAGDRPR